MGFRHRSRTADEESWKVGRILALVEDNFVGKADSEELIAHFRDWLTDRLDELP